MESFLGPLRFLILISVFIVSTGVCVVMLSYLLEVILGFHALQLMSQCAVGFSGKSFF